jgi:hypothetical protein
MIAKTSAAYLQEQNMIGRIFTAAYYYFSFIYFYFYNKAKFGYAAEKGYS